METKSKRKSETEAEENNDLKNSTHSPIPEERYTGSQTNGMAIASMVLGIAGWVLCAGGGIGSIVGLILGIVALNQIKKNPNQEGKGMAIAGIILNSLCLLGMIFFILAYGAVIIAAIIGAGMQ